MEVALSQEERAEVVAVLEAAFRDLRVEIRHTHDSEARMRLKHRESVLRGVLERLGVVLEVEVGV